jgi:hypothetical protein
MTELAQSESFSEASFSFCACPRLCPGPSESLLPVCSGTQTHKSMYQPEPRVEFPVEDSKLFHSQLSCRREMRCKTELVMEENIDRLLLRGVNQEPRKTYY